MLGILTGHESTINVMAVLPDGRLASWSWDRTIRLWDPATSHAGSGQLLFVADAAISALGNIPGASPGEAPLVAGDASGRLHWLRLQVT